MERNGGSVSSSDGKKKAWKTSGAIGARLSTDAASVRALVGDALGLLVQNIATAVASLVIAFDAS